MGKKKTRVSHEEEEEEQNQENLNQSSSYKKSLYEFQTTAPKSCYMRPPGGILAPGESLIATVFKFVEPPENNERLLDQKSKVKFKIISLKVKGEMDDVPELGLVSMVL